MNKIIKNICIFMSYFVYDLIFTLILIGIISLLKLINIDINNMLFKQIFLGISETIYITFILFIYRKEYIEDLTKLKEKNISFFLKYIPLYVLGVFLMMVANIIIFKLTNVEMSQNEQSVREMLRQMPIYMSISICIFAPILEEAIFRKSIRNIFKNPIIFILISSIAFGLIHVIGDENFGIISIINSIPYMIMGFDFAYIYYKSDNIFTTMFLHSMHNLLLLVLQFIGG